MRGHKYFNASHFPLATIDFLEIKHAFKEITVLDIFSLVEIYSPLFFHTFVFIPCAINIFGSVEKKKTHLGTIPRKNNKWCYAVTFV